MIFRSVWGNMYVCIARKAAKSYEEISKFPYHYSFAKSVITVSVV